MSNMPNPLVSEIRLYIYNCHHHAICALEFDKLQTACFLAYVTSNCMLPGLCHFKLHASWPMSLANAGDANEVLSHCLAPKTYLRKSALC